MSRCQSRCLPIRALSPVKLDPNGKSVLILWILFSSDNLASTFRMHQCRRPCVCRCVNSMTFPEATISNEECRKRRLRLTSFQFIKVWICQSPSSQSRLWRSAKLIQDLPDCSIPAIARTVHHAFSSDPLIRWLRPSAVPWVQQDTGIWSWQYRRIQRIILEGQVFRSGSVEQMAQQYPRRGKYQESTERPHTALATLPDKEPTTSLLDEDFVSSSDDAGAVVFLFPPPAHLSWSIRRLWLACKLWLLDYLTPAHDSGVREKVTLKNTPIWRVDSNRSSSVWKYSLTNMKRVRNY
jgi:hypothetical protein